MIVQGEIVLFTGPAAAGKSTIAETWASGHTARTACFDHDQARFLMRAGYVSRSAARADESLREEGDRQWLLSIAVCEAMAETYDAELNRRSGLGFNS
jgi:adenylylsulfate kinase-like enzyme